MLTVVDTRREGPRRAHGWIAVLLLVGAGCTSTPVESRYEWAPARPTAAAEAAEAAPASTTVARPVAASGAADRPLASVLRTGEGDWLAGPVGVIARPEEQQQYAALTTGAQRAAFVEEFWRRRDNSPEDDVNEARQEFERRVAAAERAFGSEGEPGWRTSFGVALLVVGFPYSVTLRRGDYEQSRNASFAIPDTALNGDQIVWHYVPQGLSPSFGQGPLLTELTFRYVAHRWQMACGPVAWSGAPIVGGTWAGPGLGPPGPSSSVGSHSTSSTDDMGAGMYYGPPQSLLGRRQSGSAWFAGIGIAGTSCEGLWMTMLRGWWGI